MQTPKTHLSASARYNRATYSEEPDNPALFNSQWQCWHWPISIHPIRFTRLASHYKIAICGHWCDRLRAC